MNKSDQSYTYFVSFDGEDEPVKVPAADISSAELREVE
jgi:RNA polymerase-interacting CarD/CdnL/TRCF family regulator